MIRRKTNSGLVDIAYLGGFIEKCLVDELKEDYPMEIINRVMRNTTLDSSVYRICDEVSKVYKIITSYPNHVYSDIGKNKHGKRLSLFGNWLLDQDIRCKALKIKSNKKTFWEDEAIGEYEAECADSMIAVEEKVLSYMLGLETGKEMSPEEISKLPEFDCDVSWIERILSSIQNTFEVEDEFGLFDSFCDYFSRKDKESNE